MNSFNDFLHQNFGAYKYRPQIKVRTDAFYEYIPADSPRDHRVISRLSNSIIDLNDSCFQLCVDPGHKYFTYTEEKCVEGCVRHYFQGFEAIVSLTGQRLKQQKQHIKKQVNNLATASPPSTQNQRI